MDRPPRLAIVYGHRSFDAMQLRAAARGLCEVIWLVDAADPAAVAAAPLLRRSGPVVPALGLPAQEAAASLRQHAPDGIATFYDTGMEHVARIAAELELPFNEPHTALALEDKLHQRTALRDGGIDTPAVIELPAGADLDQLRPLFEAAPFPAVLKPRRNSGSWHTFKVDDAAELLQVLEALEAEPGEDRILEGYLPDGPQLPAGFEADYVSVETVATAGVFTHLAITGRLPLAPPLRETGFFIPSTLDAATAAAVVAETESALHALSFHVGCAHTEIKLTADGPKVIEINGRIGGGVPEMLSLGAGIDVVGMAMRAALGLELEVESMPETAGVAYRFFYQPPAFAQRLTKLDGLDEVGRLPGVSSVFMHHPPGTELDARHGTRTYLCAVVGLAEDHAGVVRAHEQMCAHVSAEYERWPDQASGEPAAGPRPEVSTGARA